MESAETGVIRKVNPATGEVVGEFAAASEAEVNAAVSRSRSAWASWRKASLAERSKVLRDVSKALYQSADALAGVISRETGKSLKDALEADIGTGINIAAYYAEIGPRLLKKKALKPDPVSVLSGRSHWETYHPRGVVGVISPWNYPLAIAASGIMAALMAGNTVILKPSEMTPQTGIVLVELIQKILRDAGYPAAVVQVLTGDGRTGAALVNADVDYAVFTGSHRAGREVLAAMARKGRTASLELGGNDAMIVLPDANLEAAASYAVWGRFVNAGQACAAVKRLYVPRAQHDQLRELVKEKVSQLRVGGPEVPGAHLGPLINGRQLETLEAQVQDAIAKGATLITGGRRRPGPGFFYEPTLMTDVPAEARVLTEETFGPVLPLIPYDNIDEVVQQVNASNFGLTTSIFGNVAQAEALGSRIESGTVVINDVGASNYAMTCAPWSGWKNSGPGASHGEKALLDMGRVQIVSRNRAFDLPFLRQPLWHFSREAACDLSCSDSKALLSIFAARSYLSLLNPAVLIALWKNRSATKL